MKKRKVKRYNGEETSVVETPDITEETESERRSKGLLSEQGKIIGGAMAPRRKIEDYIRKSEKTSDESGSKEQTFGQAFAEARRGGAKTFEFGGKRYTTELAGEAKASRPAQKRQSFGEEEARKMGEGYKKAAYDTEKQRQARMAKEQALETVSPESYLIGGPSLRAVKGAAEALAAKQGIKTVGKRLEPHLGEMKDINPRATARIGIEPLKIGREPLKLGMKKGGAVKKYSSGGSVSSASKRADGIAQKGKTRGRIC